MTRTYRVSPEQLVDWEGIKEADVVELAAFQAKLEEIDKPIISANALYTVAKETISNPTHARAFVRQLLIVGELKRAARDDAKEVVNDIFRAVLKRVKNSTPDAHTEFEKKLDERRDVITSLVSSRHVRASAKAIALSYMEDSIFRDSVIINDLRPIYDDDRKEIDGFVICQHLHIEYTSPNGRLETLTLALDQSDIKTLQEVLSDALNKIETANKYVGDNTKLGCVIAGSETYGLRD